MKPPLFRLAAGLLVLLAVGVRSLEWPLVFPGDGRVWLDPFDGAYRAGWEPQQILDAIRDKQARNEARTWPDWRTAPRDKAIEHVRGGALRGDQ